MAADGSAKRRLTSGGLGLRAPAWSPDGERIAFERWIDNNAEIYVMKADGRAGSDA